MSHRLCLTDWAYNQNTSIGAHTAAVTLSKNTKYWSKIELRHSFVWLMVRAPEMPHVQWQETRESWIWILVPTVLARQCWFWPLYISRNFQLLQRIIKRITFSFHEPVPFLRPVLSSHVFNSDVKCEVSLIQKAKSWEIWWYLFLYRVLSHCAHFLILSAPWLRRVSGRRCWNSQSWGDRSPVNISELRPADQI